MIAALGPMPPVMSTPAHLPDAGSYVEMTAADDQAARVRVVRAEGQALTLSAPLAAVPPLGEAVVLRWSAAPRGRYALPCVVVGVDENRIDLRTTGELHVEQLRHFVRGGGGETVIMRRGGKAEVHGWIRDISEHSVRAHFQGTEVAEGEEMRLWIELGGQVVDLRAETARVEMMQQQVPPGPMSVELVAVFEADETQARVIRQYIMRLQLLSRTRA
jgi:acylphosphatase